MKPHALALLLAVLLVAPACAQAPAADGRQARILENLKYEFPQLREVDLSIQELAPSEIDGLDQGVLVIPGQRPVPFLVSEDDAQLYLIAAGPIDASRTEDQLADALEAEATEAREEARVRSEELDALAASLPVRGNPDAAVTIVEFSDFECPYCARAANSVKTVLDQHGDDVRFVYAHYPLPNHPWARPSAIASVCAAQQSDDVFWMLHDYYFANQRQITTGNVMDKTREQLAATNLDMDAWSVCATDRSSDAYAAAASVVDAMVEAGQRYGVTGTPSFFVNGVKLSGVQPPEAFTQAIQEAQAATE